MGQSLKPCPFCGGEAKVQGNIVFKEYSIICLNERCGAHVFFYGAEANKSANERRWNKRTERSEE